MLIGLAAGLLAALLYGAPAAVQAHASRSLPEGSWWQVTRAAVTDPLLVGVACCDVVGAVFHYVAIQRLPLYLAQTAVATSLLFTAVASASLLRERLVPRQWAGIAAVCVGLTLLALGAGRAGGHRLGGGLPWLAAAVAAMAVLAVALRRVRGTSGGVVYGLLAGASYGAVPVGVRLVVAPYLRLEVLLVLVALAAFGGLGFACYSLAMQRAPVTTSGAPLSLAETLVPSVLGLVLFGDRIRHGWSGVVALGVAVGLAGIVAVSRPAAAAAEPAEILTS